MRFLPSCTALCLAVLTLLSACSKKEAAPAPPSRVWSQYVQSHTAGLISRESRITVQFVENIADQSQIGQSAAEALKIEPAIAGELVFSGLREITLAPAQPLPRGQAYRAVLNPTHLKGVPETLAPYEFGFSVLGAQFEVRAAGLEAVAGDEAALILRGTLDTADREEVAAVEKLLNARFGSETLKLEWLHVNEGRGHHFSASGIRRGNSAGQVLLSWNGNSLGLATQGQREFEVPALGVFKVLEASSQSSERQSIVVRFSDALDANQNLKGLVTLGSIKLTTQIEGNTLSVYPEKVPAGGQTLKVAAGLKNARGIKLGEAYETSILFANEKPQVRFAGSGVILPDNETLSIPIEGMNVHSVQVTAFQVYENDIGQFLQANSLSGGEELHRVGRYLWRKTLRLEQAQTNQWTRYALDATELLRKAPGGLFRLTLSINRSNSLYACAATEEAVTPAKEEPFRNNEDLYDGGYSGWEGEDYYYAGDSYNWEQRDDPCKDSYYRWGQGISDARNFLASNIGLLAKRGSGGALHVAVTNLRDATPLSGADIEVRNFQNQKIASARSDGEGLAKIDLDATPFYLVARAGTQSGYLKLARNVALPTSHFDTGGETVSGGIKGFLFGERGVWRPGDKIYLNFVLEDRNGRIPPNHPVTLQLTDPKGQLVKTLTNTQPVDDFYAFTLSTADDAPTGTWTAKALVGGAEFVKYLKIETVMPNRLKMELKFADDTLKKSQMPLKSTLWAQWLHGASAKGLKADVAAKLVALPTRFAKHSEYLFDDPIRVYRGEPQTLFEGNLDAEGNGGFNLQLAPASEPAGLLQAQFTTRVFEPGGAFSTGHSDFPYHAFDHYLGVKLPKGDPNYGMLLSNVPHAVDVVALDPKGALAQLASVELKVYNLEWRWWWERGQNNLAQFTQANFPAPVHEETVTLKDGKGSGHFEVKAPNWSRYLVRVCDVQSEKGGGHCTGQIIYMGQPWWTAGTDQQAGPAASALMFSADKPKYLAGETAVLQLPKATQGRALLSIENGSRVLSQRWLQLDAERGKLEVPLTADMAPNVFVSLTLIQPHSGKTNDRPIRLYGVIPLEVSDPATVLTPIIKADKLWRPEGKVSVQISEAQGRAMTYSLAVVDEGLLGLTNYKTPNPHEQFYKREALGVSTWDLFDEVAGAYGGALERLLALGGDEGGPIRERQEQKRFPPVVRVLGPFHLDKGKTDTRELDLPQYVGEVRVMVVAGYQGAYGSAQQSITVRTPLSLITTLPRVLGPGETVSLPVSVFAYEPEIREVKLSLEADKKLFEVSESPGALHFEKPGEQLASFTLKVREAIGSGKVVVRAISGGQSSVSTLNMSVRTPNPPVTTVLRKDLEPGENWTQEIKPYGLARTTNATLEVSRVPAINLEKRLGYLIQYPHGCLEQTISSVFPQLYLDQLVQLDDNRRLQVERNIQTGIERLRSFQSGGQGFVYWPGGGDINDWANNYAGHFLAEAKKLGYQVPSAMFEGWVDFQKSAATRWTSKGFDSIENQAYRLYTLALADQPEVGAMNRLREEKTLSVLARWQLAAAYIEIGQADAARAVMRGEFKPGNYTNPGETFGSYTRDDAILLIALAQLGEREQAARVALRLGEQLGSDSWYSTQSTAYALMAMARYAGRLPKSDSFSFEFTQNSAKPVAVTAGKALSSQPLEMLNDGGKLTVRNTSQQRLFISLLLRGSPAQGAEKAENEGLLLNLEYTDTKGEPVEIKNLSQGSDFVAHVNVTNRSVVRLDDLALTHMVAAGWEIHNPRFAGEEENQLQPLDYQDIRDDRVLSYFKLAPGETRRLKVLLNASYRGRYYLPAVSVESMYDASKHARTAGQWVNVKSGE